MKGFIAFYINYQPELQQDIESMVKMFTQVNREVIDRIQNDNDYRVVVIPCTKESCRIEKVDLDKPYPRFVSKLHIDLAELEKRREERRLDRESRKDKEE